MSAMQDEANAIVDVVAIMLRHYYQGAEHSPADLYRWIRRVTETLFNHEQDTPERMLIEHKALVQLAQLFHTELED